MLFRAAAAGLVWVALAFTIGACSSTDSTGSRDQADPWTAEEVEARLVEIRTTPDETERLAMLVELGDHLDGETATVLHDQIASRVSTWRPLDRLVLLDLWARFQPAAATRWSLVGASTHLSVVATEIASDRLARRDPQEILSDWEKPGGPLLDGLVAGWFVGGAPGLEDWIFDDLGAASIEGQAALAIYFRRALELEGPDGATRRADEMLARDLKPKEASHVRRMLGSEMGMVEPKRAMAYFDRNREAIGAGMVLSDVAQRLAHKDGRTTMEWLRGMDGLEEADHRHVARAAFQIWSTAKRAEAMEWALAIPESERGENWFSGVVSRMVGLLSWVDAPNALAWAEWIVDEDERELAAVSIVRRWRGKDLAAAEAWIETSSLSDDARAKARYYPENYRGPKPEGE